MEAYLQQEKTLEAEIEQKANLTFEHQKKRAATRAKLEQANVIAFRFILIENREAQQRGHNGRQHISCEIKSH